MKTKSLTWLALSSALAAMFAIPMFFPEYDIPKPLDRDVFLPGATTDGHYQIELACETCHTENFSDMTSMQTACVDCHGAELELANDSHPRSKFTDPRNADRVEVLDARWCVTCHQEHRPEITASMGLSLQADYCYQCHQGIAEERPTHAGLAFDSCANGGCHNFHDNRALYEDFLVEHANAPPHLATPIALERDLLSFALANGFASEPPLSEADADAPSDLLERDRWVQEWLDTSHAKAGVNCTDCHASEETPWVDQPQTETCGTCHELEEAGFNGGRHGMRAAANLPPMTPSLARLPMHADASALEISCNSCHQAHAYDTAEAAVQACLGCHADEHTKAYAGSPHESAWKAEVQGDAPANSGVSCATCHLPRVETEATPPRTLVAHNQNDFLRPNEKMIRPVCMNCHGLGFSIDALADESLVANNFRGQPSREVESIHYATVLRWELDGRVPEQDQKETKEP